VPKWQKWNHNIQLGTPKKSSDYNLEFEHAKHKIHADSFRSFDINGLDAKFNRTSVNLIVNF
jgi:hypothetical protein